MDARTFLRKTQWTIRSQFMDLARLANLPNKTDPSTGELIGVELENGCKRLAQSLKVYHEIRTTEIENI